MKSSNRDLEDRESTSSVKELQNACFWDTPHHLRRRFSCLEEEKIQLLFFVVTSISSEPAPLPES